MIELGNCSYVDIKDLLLDYCATNKQAQKIKTMNSRELAECLFNNLESGLIPREEVEGDLSQWIDRVLNQDL